MNERNPTKQPEQAATHETDMRKDCDAPIEVLLQMLDFPQTPELTEAGQAIITGLTSETTTAETMHKAWEEYANLMEQAVESVPNSEQSVSQAAKWKTGAILHKALLFRDAGHLPRYLEELSQASDSAFHNRLEDEISAPIEREINRLLEQLPLSSEVLVASLVGSLNDAYIRVLWDLIADGADYEEVLRNARGLLIEDGEDPDKVLRSLHITQE